MQHDIGDIDQFNANLANPHLICFFIVLVIFSKCASKCSRIIAHELIKFSVVLGIVLCWFLSRLCRCCCWSWSSWCCLPHG
jgi:hypothetical protein